MSITPVTREEKFIQAIIDGSPLDTTPFTRVEKFLANIAGAEVTPPDPMTRKEKFLAGIAGADIVLPVPITREEQFLAAIAGMTVDPPAPVTRLEKLLAEWAEASAGEEKTVTGTVISISDALRRPAIDYTTTITPVQDLHGYDRPWVGGAGKNLFDPSHFDTNVSTVYLLFYGGYSSGAYLENGTLVKNGETYTVTVNLPSTPATAWGVYGRYEDDSTTITFSANGNANPRTFTFTATEDGKIVFWGYMSGSRTWASEGITDTTKVKVQLEKGSTATAWTPYSNICPITGHEAVNVTRTGKNLFDKTDSVLPGYVSNEGKFIANSVVERSLVTGLLKAGQYTISKASSSRFRVGVFTSKPTNVDLTSVAYWTASPQTATTLTIDIPSDGYLAIFCYNGSSEPVTTQELADSLQIELGSTATAYTPYVGDTYDVQFGEAGTVYGGQLDVTTGVLTVTHKMFINNTADMNGYSEDWPAWRDSGIKDVIGAEVNGFQYNQYMNIGTTYGANTKGANDLLMLPYSVYELTQTEWQALAMDVQILVAYKTPITYQLTPTEIQMLLGDNNVWSDTGDSTLTYWAEV